MFHKMKFVIKTLLLVATFSSLLVTTTLLKSLAAVPKSEFQAQVRLQTETLMLEKVGPDITTQQQSLVTLRSKLIADTIASIPADSISDDVAQWVKESILAVVKRNIASFIMDSPQGKTYVENYAKLLKVRFSTLDESKGKQFLLRRKTLLEADRVYRAQLRQYLITSLASVHIVRLNVGVAALQGFNDGTVSKIISALDLGIRPTYEGDPKPNMLDVSGNKIDSRILTLSLVKDLDDQLTREEVGSGLSFGNIISGAFDDDSSTKLASLKTFAEVKPLVAKLYSEYVVTSGETSTIDLYKFHYLVFEAIQLCLLKPKAPSEDNISATYLTFTSDKASWLLLSDPAAK